MELRHLRYFVAVGEHLHFGRAARRLGIAQPPLSRRIRDLEAELGLRLFERTKRRVALTRAGSAFLADVGPLLGQVERAVQRARRVDRGEAGGLSIGRVAAADFTRFSSMLRAFHERHPEIALDIKDLTTSEQVTALQEHRLDVGFLRAPVKRAWLASEPLLSEDIVLALPRDHRLTMHQRVPVRLIAPEVNVFLRRSRAPTLSDLVLGVYQRAGVTPTMSHEAEHPEALLGYVAAGLGVALVPASFQAVPRPDIVYRPVSPKAPRMEMLLAWRRNDLSPAGQAFCAIAREISRCE